MTTPLELKSVHSGDPIEAAEQQKVIDCLQQRHDEPAVGNVDGQGVSPEWKVNPYLPFLVLLVQDGGAIGGENGGTNPRSDCTWTYAVYNVAGGLLAEDVTPQRRRIEGIAYYYAGQGDSSNLGLAVYYDGELILLDAFGEGPIPYDCEDEA